MEQKEMDKPDEFRQKLEAMKLELRAVVAQHLGESVEFAITTVSRTDCGIPRLDCVTTLEPAMLAAVLQAMYCTTKIELDAESRARADAKSRIH